MALRARGLAAISAAFGRTIRPIRRRVIPVGRPITGKSHGNSRPWALLTHELLDHSILQGMKTDHDQSSTWGQRPHNLWQDGLQLTQLIVNLYANRLKRAGRWMLAGFASRDCRGDDLCQSRRRFNRRLLASDDDGSSNSPVKPFLTELRQHLSQFRFIGPRQPGGGAQTHSRVHPHIQRPRCV
jgi:hypothetical protein